MRKRQPLPIALTTSIVALLSVEMPCAQAKQRCSAAIPSQTQGSWWSYRIVDGRKCWYEGKPMLSKSLLEWPKEDSGSEDVSSARTTNDPLDAQASAPKALETFDARWRARIGDR